MSLGLVLGLERLSLGLGCLSLDYITGSRVRVSRVRVRLKG